MTGLPHLPERASEYERARFAERLAPMADEAARLAIEAAEIEQRRIALRLPKLEPAEGVRPDEECPSCGCSPAEGAAWIYRGHGPYCAPCACREHARRPFVDCGGDR